MNDMRTAFVFFGLMCILAVGCTSAQTGEVQDSLANCPRENMICPDGSIVMREGPNCEFQGPELPDDYCDYGDPARDYRGQNAEQCASIRFSCPEYAEYFSDHCGCGCQLPEWATGGTFCLEGDRYYEQCVTGGSPVCGITLNGDGGCTQEYCKTNYPNRCEACRNQDVIYAQAESC